MAVANAAAAAAVDDEVCKEECDFDCSAAAAVGIFDAAAAAVAAVAAAGIAAHLPCIFVLWMHWRPWIGISGSLFETAAAAVVDSTAHRGTLGRHLIWAGAVAGVAACGVGRRRGGKMEVADLLLTRHC